ncbi:hypothetical protein U1Q18_015860, partial [Sarracenia purpurea var. burkii]
GLFVQQDRMRSMAAHYELTVRKRSWKLSRPPGGECVLGILRTRRRVRIGRWRIAYQEASATGRGAPGEQRSTATGSEREGR